MGILIAPLFRLVVREPARPVQSGTPVPVSADALGYHPSTIERHVVAAATTYAEYIAAARDQRMTS